MVRFGITGLREHLQKQNANLLMEKMISESVQVAQ